MIELTLRNAPSVPLETEVISPDVFRDKTEQEIAGLTIYHGRRQCRIDDFFEIKGEKSEDIHVTGDMNKVRWIGRGMSCGSIRIHGNVGMHLGAHMSGGTIEVSGDASDWVGAEMTGGTIRVRGNAGGQIGGGYRGSLIGMKNGTIIIDGSAGLEVGLRMRRGLIVIGGIARDFVGLQMRGGTIVLLSGAEIRAGAWMNRGTIISLAPLQILPTYNYACQSNPTFLNVYARHLKQFEIDLPYKSCDGSYARYSGDISVPGKGELLVWEPC